MAQYMPSQFRVQRSTRVRLANLMDAGRVTDEVRVNLAVRSKVSWHRCVQILSLHLSDLDLLIVLCWGIVLIV